MREKAKKMEKNCGPSVHVMQYIEKDAKRYCVGLDSVYKEYYSHINHWEKLLSDSIDKI